MTILNILFFGLVALSINGYSDEKYQTALQSFYQGQLSQAQKYLQDSELKDGIKKNIFLAVIYINAKQPEKALDQLNSIKVALPDQHVYYYYLFFKIALLKNNIVLARANIEQISQQKNPYVLQLSRLEFADYCLKNNNYRLAKAYYLDVIRNGADSNLAPQAFQKLIDIAIIQQDEDQALFYYQRLVSSVPKFLNDKHVWASITKAFNTKHHKLKKVNAFTNADDLYSFCNTLLDKKMYYDAELYAKVYASRYTRSSNISDSYTIIGTAYFFQHHYSKSIYYLNKVIRMHPKNVSYTSALFYLGRAYQKQHSYYHSQKMYLLAINTADTKYSAMAYYYLYQLHQEMKKETVFLKQHLADFKRKYSDSPYYNKLIWEAGWDAIKQDKFTAATDILAQYSTEPADISTQSKIIFWHAKSLLRLGRKEEANQLFLECLKRYPCTFYSYRIITSYLPNQKISRYVSKNTFKKPDVADKTQWLLSVGFGKLAADELQYQIDINNNKKIDSYHEIYELVYAYSFMNQHYEAIRLIRKNAGLNVYPQKDIDIRQDYFTLLYPYPHRSIIEKYSNDFGVDPLLVLALMREESMFHNTIRSRVNAIGLMQIMPYTAKDIARQLKDNWDGAQVLENINVNIEYGVYYLFKLKTKFNNNYPLMLASYNAGPGRTVKWINQYGMNDIDYFIVNIPYSETTNYVQRVLETYWINRILYGTEG